jgi:hypothetical protein
MQYVKRMRPIILSSVACLVVSYFSTLSHKQHDFREKIIEPKRRILIFSTTFFEIFLIPIRNQRDVIINVLMSSCKLPVILVGF